MGKSGTSAESAVHTRRYSKRDWRAFPDLALDVHPNQSQNRHRRQRRSQGSHLITSFRNFGYQNHHSCGQCVLSHDPKHESVTYIILKIICHYRELSPVMRYIRVCPCTNRQRRSRLPISMALGARCHSTHSISMSLFAHRWPRRHQPPPASAPNQH